MTQQYQDMITIDELQFDPDNASLKDLRAAYEVVRDLARAVRRALTNFNR